MPTCRYCHSELQNGQCDFCGARANQQEEPHTYTEFAPAEYTYRSIEFLEGLHTLDLFLLLREVRRERSQNYDTMRVINHGADLDQGYQENAKEAGRFYRDWTKRMWVVEQIIADRLGYAPERIDDKFLHAYLRKMDKYQEKKHTIRTTRRKNPMTKERPSHDLSGRI